MNNMSLSIVTMIAYNVIIRETLEYTIPRDQYSVDAFKGRKERLKKELAEKTPLKNFLDNNKEIGKRVEDKINELYDTIYGDNSTICRVANNELRVDASQHLSVYDVVIELHEEIKKIIDGNIGFARSKGVLDNELMKLVVADEKFYRTIAFQCLYRDLHSLFFEFNKARNEAKGEITPQSNFIQGEILRIVKHTNFVKNNQSCTDRYYWEMVDYVVKTLDWTSGRRQLPENKSFEDVFREGYQILDEHMRKAQDEWTPLFNAAIKDLVETAKKNNGNLEIKIEK